MSPASAQSSISAPRIAATPPAAASASRRTSMQPPAAAAVLRSGVVHPGEGDRASGRRYTKAGMAKRSAKLSQRSFAISELSTQPLGLGARDEPGERAGRVDDVGVGQQQIAGAVARRRDPLRHRPQLAAPARRRRRSGDDGQPLRRPPRLRARPPRCRPSSRRRPARCGNRRDNPARAASRQSPRSTPPRRGPG